MRAITEWLAGLGLGEYAQRFADNDIDFSILPELTDQDLEKIGVSSLGHRRKILRAIAELKETPAEGVPVRPASAPRPVPNAAPPLASAAEVTGERRYLTVMFCDLVGSTEISAQLDVEEWRDLVGSYLDAASAAVTEMGGYVAKKLGDGILALFGYPVAHENDAERAARAALAIQRALAELNRRNENSGKPALAARIGLETGPAVVDAAGEIYGDVANVAARVQAQAEPGAVLITSRVQRQIAGLFVAEDRGEQALKGVPEPTVLFKLVRASGGGRRGGQRQLTPLIGREDETAMLMRRWERARAGDGQLVMIVGEPGLGKSRLIEEFHARLSDTPHTWVEWSCSQLLQNTPLHPIAEWGRSRFGGADVPSEGQLADLESSLAQVKLDAAEFAPLLAPLLDIRLPKERVPTLAGEELRRRQLAALTTWVLAGAKVQPVVLAFEDLHWADPTTLDVLKGIAEQGALAPLLILATTRPEFRPPWSMRSHHGTISLAPLDRAQVRDMVGELAARHALPKDVVEDVAARTGGVPLFVEEVTRLLLERGEQDSIQAIPPTLQQSLMARLDRLGPAREVAQVASVIGRGFSYKLLHDVAGMEDARLQAALEKLADADIVLVQGLPPQSEYRFKHALIQDAAYENLLKSRRQVLHRRVAEILRDRFADTAAAEPEVVAHHFTQAGMTDAAIEWWGKAGDQALRRSAFQEAIAHLGKAIEMADKEGEGKPRAAAAAASVSERLKLQTNLGRAVMWSKGFGSAETQAVYARARELAAKVDDPAAQFAPSYGQWANNAMRTGFATALEIPETFLRSTGSGTRSPEVATAHRMMGLVLHQRGEFLGAKAHLEDALRNYDLQWSREDRLGLGFEPRLTAMSYLSCTEWVLGNTERARSLIKESVAGSIEAGHVPTLGSILTWAAQLEVLRGDPAAALDKAKAAVDYARENDLGLFRPWSRVYLGSARARCGEREAGTVELQQGLAAHTEKGNKAWTPLFEGLLAQIEAEGAQYSNALDRVAKALALANEISEHWTDSVLHRFRGEILLKGDPPSTASAEEAFLTAIAISQQQKAKSFELQAALRLAKLYQSIGRSADAHAVLAPALEGFSPTPELPEIEQAQTLLAVLADTDEVKNAAAARQRRLELQTNYSQAVMQARGQHSAETQEAFRRAHELAGGTDDPLRRFSSHHGLWIGAFSRGEKSTMVEAAEALLKEVAPRPDSAEASIAHRIYGTTCWVTKGDVAAARQYFEKSLALYRPERDREAAYRFFLDIGVAAKINLSLVLWVCGEPDRAREMVSEAVAKAVETKHVPTILYAHANAAVLELIRREASVARRHADAGLTLAREHGVKVWIVLLPVVLAWADAHSNPTLAKWEEMHRLIIDCHGHGLFVFSDAMHRALAAEGLADAGSVDQGLTVINQSIADSERLGIHCFDAVSHRIRAEILLKRHPANTAPAEEAFLRAIAIAQQQKAKSFELRAALSLAKLYQSTGRAADAHAALAPALEGFAPTPEFPEIEQAQTLLATLAATDEVKNAATARQRRLKLQTSYGQAMLHAHGYSAPETAAAFTRARELAAGIEDASERFSAYYGLWASCFVGGNLTAMHEVVQDMLRDCRGRPESPEAGNAHRLNGETHWFEGNFTQAWQELERALTLFNPERDRELAFRFGQDINVTTMVFMSWVLGRSVK